MKQQQPVAAAIPAKVIAKQAIPAPQIKPATAAPQPSGISKFDKEKQQAELELLLQYDNNIETVPGSI